MRPFCRVEICRYVIMGAYFGGYYTARPCYIVPGHYRTLIVKDARVCKN